MRIDCPLFRPDYRTVSAVRSTLLFILAHTMPPGLNSKPWLPLIAMVGFVLLLIVNPSTAMPHADRLIEPCDHGQGFRVLGAGYASQQIEQHQNPPVSECPNKKFLVSHFHTSGIGSIVSVHAHCLRVAMLLDRIFVLVPDPEQLYLQGTYCAGKASLDECFLRPISTCSPRTLFPNITTMGVDFNMTLDQSSHQVVHARTAGACMHEPGAIISPLPRQDLIRVFDEHNASINNHVGFYNHWFFAQTAAYIFRLNDRTDRLVDDRIRQLKKPSVDESPIPDDAVSIFVRGGDKATEYPLSSPADYLECARHLFHERGRSESPCSNVSNASRACPVHHVILTTDSPDAVTFFMSQPDIKVHYLNVRRHDEYKKMVVDFARERGGSNEFLNHVANLKMSLRGKSFVGPLQTSNWAQLMDELLSTQECKADAEFRDPTHLKDGCPGDILVGLKSLYSRKWMTAEQVQAYREEYRRKFHEGKIIGG